MLKLEGVLPQQVSWTAYDKSRAPLSLNGLNVYPIIRAYLMTPSWFSDKLGVYSRAE